MAGCPEVLITCVTFYVSFISIYGYNLDTIHPVIKEGTNNSYFGYSVAQHQQLNRINPFQLGNDIIGNYILIGAPKEDLSDSNEKYTGAVYKCNALSPRTDDCELLLSKEYNAAATKDKGRNNQWLGVSVRSGGKGGEVVACAHRYKMTDNNYGLGTCYQMTQEMAYDQALGKGNMISPCKGLSTRKEHEEYAFCQGGTSAYVTENHRLVMGAPGAINWRGMLAEVDISPAFGIKRIYRTATTESDPVPPPVGPTSYLGYSVTGGKFDNSGLNYYVAGSPHSKDVGEVIFFSEMESGNVLKYEESQKLEGELPFSGYGQSLIAVDINNDGYEDLVVGCPFYYVEEKDSLRIGGAIYVYIGNGSQITTYTKPQIIRGRSVSSDECEKLECRHGRFGFSLANAGDLNRDSYGDFAVGAPYEGKGAVYIYHGSAGGVKEPYSQRIYAEDLTYATGWKAFGHSLAGGMDLDSNTYPDLLVGSYESNKVALLRTRPIIQLHSKVSVTPDKLNMSSDDHKRCEYDGVMFYCVEIKLCLRYTAEPAERFNNSVDIIYKIMAEPDKKQPRVEFKSTTLGNEVQSIFKLLPQARTGLANTNNPKYTCTTETAYLKDQITDVLTTLQFGISYSLPDKDLPIKSSIPNTLPDINEYPILDSGLTQTETMLITEVEFVKKCGDNNKCESNLQMMVNLDLKYNKDDIAVLELGESNILKANVRVRNVGEIAYQTAFYFTKPRSLKWKTSEPNDIGCIPVNETMIECKDIGSNELGKPLKQDAMTEFVLLFETNSEEISKVRTLTLSAWVNTTSIEQTPDTDHKIINVVVYVNADLQVIGKSEPDSAIQYSGVVRGESAIHNEHMIGQSVNHTFTIYNNGPGVVESSEIVIKWPYEMASRYEHGKHLLYLMQPPQVLDGGDAECFDQSKYVNVAGITTDDGEVEYNIVDEKKSRRRRRRQSDQSAKTDDNEDKPQNIQNDKPKTGESRENKNIAVLDCEKKTAKCYEIRCRIGVLYRNRNVKIRIRSRLWESTLLEEFRGVDEVRIRSTGKLHIRPELNVMQSNTENDIGFATTIAIPSLQIIADKPLEWWIIALAVLGGILLLILLALCLWKIGFFKRTRRDEMTTYKAKVEKKKDIHNPTYTTRMEAQKDENEYFLKH